jgi:HEAT repeat protein
MRVLAARDRHGTAYVVGGCIALLEQREVDDALVVVLGGEHAAVILVDGPRDHERYWLRVWAARGLLHLWDEAAIPSIVDALSDDAWRVREMAAKVVARHRLDDALPQIIVLRDDSVLRVRQAAERALRALTSS